MRIFHGMLGLLLFTSCISVPPAEDPPINARKATAVVDSNGRRIEGGNLVIEIPAGALDESERITVTIDSVRGAPGRHLGDAYLVSPEGQTFNLPVKITYQYKEPYVANVVDLNALFMGVAVGASWQPLAAQNHDQANMTVAGEVTHFSTFGLVDPNAALDAGVPTDAAGHDLTGNDAGPRDHNVADANRVDAAVNNSLLVRLSWTNKTDIDLHLLTGNGLEFSPTGDCMFSNCTVAGASLDWPPTGAVGDPLLDDVMDGTLGPEKIVIAQPADANLIVGVHGYTSGSGGGAFPTAFTVTVFRGSAQILTTSSQLPLCNDFRYVADIAVTGSGASVNATARSDGAFVAPSGHASCP